MKIRIERAFRNGRNKVFAPGDYLVPSEITLIDAKCAAIDGFGVILREPESVRKQPAPENKLMPPAPENKDGQDNGSDTEKVAGPKRGSGGTGAKPRRRRVKVS